MSDRIAPHDILGGALIALTSSWDEADDFAVGHLRAADETAEEFAVADGHDDGFRAGLLRVIRQARDFRCQGVYADAETALEGLPHDKADVVLMDINLPVLDGYGALARLRADPDTARIPVVAVSAVEAVNVTSSL